MPISQRTATSGTGASGANVTITLPTGTTNGDYLVVVIAMGINSLPGTPTGWLALAANAAGTTEGQAMFGAPYSAGLTLTFTMPAAANAWCCNAYYQAGATVGPDTAATGTGVTNGSVGGVNTQNNTGCPSATATTPAGSADYEVITFAAQGGLTCTYSAGSTLDVQVSNGTTVSVNLGHNTTNPLAASTATPTFTATWSAIPTSRNKSGGIVLLKATAPPVPLTGTTATQAASTATLSQLLGPVGPTLAVADSLSATTLNAGLWGLWGTGASLQTNLLPSTWYGPGVIQVSPTGTSGAYGGLLSNATYDATNRSLFVHVAPLGTPLTGQVSTAQLQIDSNNYVEIGFVDQNIVARYCVAGTLTTLANIPAPNGAINRWLRITENGGKVYYFYTAANDALNTGNWTQLASTPDPFVMTAVLINLVSGCYLTVASPVGTWWSYINWWLPGGNTSVGQGTLSATLSYAQPLPASIAAAQAATSASLTITYPLAGTTVAQAGLNVAAAPTLLLRGTTVTQAALVAAAPTLQLAGSSVAQATFTAPLPNWLLSGTINAQAGLSASLQFKRPIWPAFRYTAILGTFYTRPGRIELGAPLLVANVVTFIGQPTAQASSTASLSVSIGAVATGAVVGQGSTAAGVTLRLTPAPIVAQATSAVAPLIRLPGLSAGQGTTTATLAVAQALTGAIVGQGTTNVTATGLTAGLAGAAIVGQGTVYGALRLALTGTVAGQAALDQIAAAPTILLTGVASAQAQTTATPGVALPLAVGITGQAASAAGLLLRLTGLSAGQGSSTGTFVGSVPFVGGSSGQGASTAGLTLLLTGVAIAQAQSSASPLTLTNYLTSGVIGQGSSAAGLALLLTGTALGQGGAAATTAAPIVLEPGTAVGQGASAAALQLAVVGATVGQGQTSAGLTVLLTGVATGQGQSLAAPTILLGGGVAVGQGGSTAGLLLALTGQSVGQATTTGAARLLLASGLIGQGQTTAGLTVWLGTGVTGGQGSATGAPQLAFAGGPVGQATGSAALLLYLTGQVGGQASSSVVFQGQQPIAGAVAGQASSSAALWIALTGIAGGQASTGTTPLYVSQPLPSTGIVGQGATTAGLLVNLVGAPVGQGQATAGLALAVGGATGGQASSASGLWIGLAGGVVGQGASSAGLTLNLIGGLVGQAESDAGLALAVAGATVGQGSAGAGLTLALTGDTTGQGTTTAGPTVLLTGVIVAQATSYLALAGEQPLASEIVGQGSTTAALWLALAGDAQGQGSLDAALSVYVPPTTGSVISDIDVDHWINQVGAPASYVEVSEVIPDDTTYDQSPVTLVGESEPLVMGIQPLVDPGTGYTLMLAMRLRTLGGPNLRMDLLDNSGVQVATRLFVPTGAFTEVDVPFTVQETDAYRVGAGFSAGGQIRLIAVAP
jgi:hypothetical protein